MTGGLRVALTILAVTSIAAKDKEVAPFRTEIVVRWGAGAGSDVFRDEVARSLAGRLASDCFKAVEVVDRPAADADADLVYTLILSDVLEETRFDDTIAGVLNPDQPTSELRRVAYFEVSAEATLTTRADGAIVHHKRMVAHAARRPIYVGEDPQAYARDEAIRDIVDTLARSLGCGSAKLGRKIREALPQ
jgi:hypothetical protein